MGAEKQGTDKPRIATAISIGKDFISLLRDGALFLLAILLVAFPVQFNSILVDAGFKEGSLAGFKWESSLLDSNQALEEAQAKISELQRENNEQVKALAEARASLTDSALKQRITKFEKDNIALKEQTVEVQNSVSQTINRNVTLVQKTQLSRNKSAYLVGLQTLGIPDTERIAINTKLQSHGYGLDKITWSYPAGERPSWFASRSTVFYYAASALPAAQELARFMETSTKQEFAVQRGAGLGVDPSLRDMTLFVHYIKG